MARHHLALICALAVALGVPAAGFAGRSIVVGAAEDSVKQVDLSTSVARMTLARLAGLRAVRVTAQWDYGMRRPESDHELALENAASAAQLSGIRLYVAVYPRGASATPLTEDERADFAAYAGSVAETLQGFGVRDFIVGNEPNLNRFWMPQFAPDGSDAAAGSYLALLARTYDALKALSPEIRVIGGAVSPRGGDKALSIRPTHSPTAFIRDLGAAYRASGRAASIMDVFALHPYTQTSSTPPTVTNPRSTTIALADYDKLVRLLTDAFQGTVQNGKTLPILYAEYGVQTRTPPAKAIHYTNHRAPAAGDAVSESMQAGYYRQALAIAACQPNVVGLLLFLVFDEPDLRAWQSGLYYADGTPKSSLSHVRKAADDATAGTLGGCGQKR